VHLTAAIPRNYRDETEPAPGAALVPISGRREERIIELCEGMMDITAALFNVSSKELRSSGRGSLGVSRVRHIAMYVAHVALRLPMRDVGRGFGRDRTTVVHACHLVEDLRDDEDFDRMVAMTERVALAAFSSRAGL
jgi:chromosomal replication initiation ATPase DnaA